MEETNNNADITPMEEKLEKKRRATTRKSSRVWEFFIKLDDAHAMCKTCHNKISFKTTVTNLKRHMLRQHEYIYKTRLSEAPEQDLDLVLEADDEYYVEIETAEPGCEPAKKRAKIEIIDSLSSSKPMIEYDPLREDDELQEETTEQETTPIVEQPRPRKYSLDRIPYAHDLYQGKDEYSVFGELVAFRLRKIIGAKRRLVLQNRINQLLFVAEMENFK